MAYIKEDNLELDPRILAKNLEITKLTQQVDSLRSELIDIKESKITMLNHAVLDEQLIQLKEIIDYLDKIEDSTTAIARVEMISNLIDLVKLLKYLKRIE